MFLFKFCIFLIFLNFSSQNVFIEPPCNKNTCVSAYGECVNDICLCAQGYTTVITTTNVNNLSDTDFTYCNYVYRYKDWAIYFEVVLPFGVGHFYALRYLHALFKFVLFWFLSLNKVLFKKEIKSVLYMEKTVYWSMWIFGIFYVVDYCGYFFDYYTDGNGMILQ